MKEESAEWDEEGREAYAENEVHWGMDQQSCLTTQVDSQNDSAISSVGDEDVFGSGAPSESETPQMGETSAGSLGGENDHYFTECLLEKA